MELRVCFPTELGGVNGVASFQRKLTAGLHQRGVAVTYDLGDKPYQTILVLNSTRHLRHLWQAKRKGIRIVQRLGGLNWMHRFRPLNLKNYLLNEYRNLSMRFVRAKLADHLVYQSYFVKEWWEQVAGRVEAPHSVIYNAVDLSLFQPEGPTYQSGATFCLISVEGVQGSDPWDIAVQVATALTQMGASLELIVFGNVDPETEKRYAAIPFVNYQGVIANEQLPYYYRGANLYLAGDVIAACPNSVIEALACGVPVLGYRAGALPEMVTDGAGYVIEPEGLPMRAESLGNIAQAAEAAYLILANNQAYRQRAAALARERYSLDDMVEKYRLALEV